ncbi:hypothetical protein M0R45_031329 [Rubus argutus]|uniref:Ubiquitin-like domain-containing protein n=1 Tax=Rubus argutus TaxID=59490 RepID=A0AAW1WDY8_RUBAR
MKLTVKTLKGSHFEIRVQPTDTVMGVKKNIEDIQGKDYYPCGQQLLIHNGKVLKDETTLAENKVTEDGFLVVMLSKSKTSGVAGASSAQPASTNPPTTAPITNSTTRAEAPIQAPPSETPTSDTANVHTDTYGQAASNLVAGTNLDETIQQIMDMAYNNPERAVDYLYSSIPETAEVAVPVAHFPGSQATETGTINATPVSGAPNSAPLNMFPRKHCQVLVLVHLDPLTSLGTIISSKRCVQWCKQTHKFYSPCCRSLEKQNPQLLRLIQEHHTEFPPVINEPLEGSEGDMRPLNDLRQWDLIRASLIEAFLACDRNEELAANYLLENAGDFED